jgi:hypothetical protein
MKPLFSWQADAISVQSMLYQYRMSIPLDRRESAGSQTKVVETDRPIRAQTHVYHEPIKVHAHTIVYIMQVGHVVDYLSRQKV